MIISPEMFKDLLKRNGMTIVAAESITAGLFASTLASVKGASAILKGSVVTYNIDMKKIFWGVKESTLEEHTAESMQTTREMVEGLRKAYNKSSIYIAVTGVASPGTPEYPVKEAVGTTFVVCWMEGQLHEWKELITSEERNEIRQRAVDFMMEKVYRLVEEKYGDNS
jgi:nicotinamide-nucleotide amidase